MASGDLDCAGGAVRRHFMSFKKQKKKLGFVDYEPSPDLPPAWGWVDNDEFSIMGEVFL